MKKAVIALLIVAGALVTTGGIIVAVAAANGAFNSNTLSVTHEHNVTESFTNITVDTRVSDYTFTKSTDGACKVTCVEKEKYYHVVEVKDDTLKIGYVDNYNWFERMNGYSNIKVTVALPEASYNNFIVTNTTGDLNMDGFSFNNFTVKVSTGGVNVKNIIVAEKTVIGSSTGHIDLSNINSKSLELSASTGRIKVDVANVETAEIGNSTGGINLNELKATGNVYFHTSTGDIILRNVDANEMKMTASTGDIHGNIISNHTFEVKTSTGHKNYPSQSDGPKCIIETSTGDVDIEVKTL